MRKWKFSLPVLMALIAALAQPLVAAAHPLGNFTVNHYSRLELYANQVRVRYVLDMAEIPTFQAMSDIDQNGDGQVSQAENDRYRPILVEQLRQNLTLTLNGHVAPLTAAVSDMSFPMGQGNLNTLRLTIWFEAPMPAGAGGSVTVNYQDNNAGDHVGWNEILLLAAPGVTVGQSDIGTTDQSNELRAYPLAMLSSPLNVRSAHLDYALGAGAANAPALNGEVEAPVTKTDDPFAHLVHIDDLSPAVILFALLAAAVYGALHAFTPGHGKAMVGAYLVGSRGTPRHALLLGLTVTTTHTLGVYALGLITLFAARFILPERLYPILGAVSGGIVVLIGITMFVTRVRAARAKPAVALSAVPMGPVAEADQDGLAPHSHGGLMHTHLPAPSSGGKVSIRNLLTLGISGGLVPCPSALLVMLGAVALNRVAFGLVLIVAFSVGLAAVLMGTGLALVYAGRLFDRLPINARSIHWVSAASALIMAVIGLAAVWQALGQITI
jgi:nickel/cobalt exporter